MRRLTEQGAEVDEASLPVPFEPLLAVHGVIASSEAGTVHGALYEQFSEHYWPSLRATIETGQLIPAAVYLRAARLLRRYRVQMAAIFGDFDALIAPTASNLPPDRTTTGDARFQSIWTICGFPNISIPTGLSDDRLPLAMQIVGRPFDERKLLGVAAWCESIFGRLPCPI